MAPTIWSIHLQLQHSYALNGLAVLVYPRISPSFPVLAATPTLNTDRSAAMVPATPTESQVLSLHDRLFSSF